MNPEAAAAEAVQGIHVPHHESFSLERATAMREARLTSGLGCCSVGNCGDCPVSPLSRFRQLNELEAINEPLGNAPESTAATTNSTWAEAKKNQGWSWGVTEITAAVSAAEKARETTEATSVQAPKPPTVETVNTTGPTVETTATQRVETAARVRREAEAQATRITATQNQAATASSQKRSARAAQTREAEAHVVRPKTRHAEDAEFVTKQLENSRASQESEAVAVTRDSQHATTTRAEAKTFEAAEAERSSRAQQVLAAEPTPGTTKSAAGAESSVATSAPPKAPPPLRLAPPNKKPTAPAQSVQPPKPPSEPKLKLVPKAATSPAQAKPPITRKPDIVKTQPVALKHPELKLVVTPPKTVAEQLVVATSPEPAVPYDKSPLPRLRRVGNVPAVIPTASETSEPINRQPDMSTAVAGIEAARPTAMPITVEQPPIKQSVATGDKPAIRTVEISPIEPVSVEPTVEIDRPEATAADQAEIIDAWPQIVRDEAVEPQTGSDKIDEAVTVELDANTEEAILRPRKQADATDAIRTLHLVSNEQNGDVEAAMKTGKLGKYAKVQIEAPRTQISNGPTSSDPAKNKTSLVASWAIWAFRKLAA